VHSGPASRLAAGSAHRLLIGAPMSEKGRDGPLVMIEGNHWTTVQLESIGKKLDRLIEDVRKQSEKIESIQKTVDRTRINGRRIMIGVIVLTVALCWLAFTILTSLE
jgi:hypothetical protein